MDKTPDTGAENPELQPHYSGYGLTSLPEESRTAPSDFSSEPHQQSEIVPEKRQRKVAHTLFVWSLVFWILNMLSILAAVVQFVYVDLVPVEGTDYRGMWVLILVLTIPLGLILSGLLSLIGWLVGFSVKDRDSTTHKWKTWNGVSLAAAIVILMIYLSWFIPQMS